MKAFAKLLTWMGTLTLLAAGCATRPPHEEANDPLEPVNRAIYTFNDYLDRGVLKPVAQQYVRFLPDPARTGVRNVFNNLLEPITIINDVLQGKGHQAASDTMRFGFNTIFGVFGLWDVSTDWGLERHSEDFGQTFAAWGFGEGWYLVLPLLGPSNVRDGVGVIAAWKLQPVPYLVEDTITRYGIYTLYFISQRADLLSASEVLDTAALDPYLQVREAYRQKRWSDIHDGNPPEPDFFDQELFKDEGDAPAPR
jgi:phospholipid-binding lipoprotein MlaA